MRERPQQLGRKDPVLANFRPDKFSQPSPAAKARAKRAAREGNSEDHLALLRQLPCVCCERKSEDCHHLKSLDAAKHRGVGLRAPDMFALGICRMHHNEIERLGSRREFAWFQDNFGIHPHALAEALWRSTGNLQAMSRILLAHKLEATRKLLG